ncbi:MAG: sigma-70 family RNA polymerase sigma factor [Micrococcales bacterium]|nr:sigma-70 family RNA polymerase sigma factor [Micrococcales bacterium]
MDRDQFVTLFRAHLQDVSKYLSRRVDRDQVEDLASEIFEIAWRKKADCPEGMELAWLYKIAGFVVSNHRRKAVNRIIHLPILDTDKSAPSAEDMALDGSGVATAFASLSGSDRQLLSLLVFEELSIKEISVVLGTSENTTSQRLKRARERLAANLASQLSDI